MQKFGNDGTEFWWNDEVQNLGLKIGVFFVSFFYYPIKNGKTRLAFIHIIRLYFSFFGCCFNTH